MDKEVVIVAHHIPEKFALCPQSYRTLALHPISCIEVTQTKTRIEGLVLQAYLALLARYRFSLPIPLQSSDEVVICPSRTCLDHPSFCSACSMAPVACRLSTSVLFLGSCTPEKWTSTQQAIQIHMAWSSYLWLYQRRVGSMESYFAFYISSLIVRHLHTSKYLEY